MMIWNSLCAPAALFCAAENEPAPLIGGQAVMGGVLMRNGGVCSLAVRRSSGEITVERRGWRTMGPQSLRGRRFLRGFPILAETMVNGVKDALKYLSEKEMVRLFEREALRSPYYGRVDASPDPELTEEQREALAELIPALRAPRRPFLLHGVTGSGKTEVFIR
ncbi:MAG: hypothetical protein J6P53_04215, partial [Mailhella sp.]|nr:hypothetical protein [Mailhella sp.]